MAEAAGREVRGQMWLPPRPGALSGLRSFLGKTPVLEPTRCRFGVPRELHGPLMGPGSPPGVPAGAGARPAECLVVRGPPRDSCGQQLCCGGPRETEGVFLPLLSQALTCPFLASPFRTSRRR